MEILFSERPTNPSVGDLVNFSDGQPSEFLDEQSTRPTWGTPISGGGTFHVLSRWNGSDWTLVGM